MIFVIYTKSVGSQKWSENRFLILIFFLFASGVLALALHRDIIQTECVRCNHVRCHQMQNQLFHSQKRMTSCSELISSNEQNTSQSCQIKTKERFFCSFAQMYRNKDKKNAVSLQRDASLTNSVARATEKWSEKKKLSLIIGSLNVTLLRKII